LEVIITLLNQLKFPIILHLIFGHEHCVWIVELTFVSVPVQDIVFLTAFASVASVSIDPLKSSTKGWLRYCVRIGPIASEPTFTVPHVLSILTLVASLKGF
jgi:hypothetical protein